jgi:hypothetical protein
VRYITSWKSTRPSSQDELPGTVFGDNRDMAKHGFTIQQVKEWREKELKAGRPSGLEDFYRAHNIDICVECSGQGTRAIGARWRDEDGFERSEAGPVAYLVQRYNLDKPKRWLTNVRKWDYLYVPCPSCEGSGKLSKTSKSADTVE